MNYYLLRRLLQIRGVARCGEERRAGSGNKANYRPLWRGDNDADDEGGDDWLVPWDARDRIKEGRDEGTKR